jgi:hypothetical protein
MQINSSSEPILGHAACWYTKLEWVHQKALEEQRSLSSWCRVVDVWQFFCRVVDVSCLCR